MLFIDNYFFTNLLKACKYHLIWTSNLESTSLWCKYCAFQFIIITILFYNLYRYLGFFLWYTYASHPSYVTIINGDPLTSGKWLLFETFNFDCFNNLYSSRYSNISFHQDSNTLGIVTFNIFFCKFPTWIHKNSVGGGRCKLFMF